jgi:hypothetical protein
VTIEFPTLDAGTKGTTLISSAHARNIGPLQCFFSPASVAVIGATDRSGSVGNTVLRNLLANFKGHTYAVNPGKTEVCGLRGELSDHG